jgi:hypothetical protein
MTQHDSLLANEQNVLFCLEGEGVGFHRIMRDEGWIMSRKRRALFVGIKAACGPLPQRQGFHPHPGGMFDNSPTFQRLRWSAGSRLVPKGRLTPLAVQPSLRDLGALMHAPGVETPGYYRSSLRDGDTERPAQIQVALDKGSIAGVYYSWDHGSKASDRIALSWSRSLAVSCSDWSRAFNSSSGSPWSSAMTWGFLKSRL